MNRIKVWVYVLAVVGGAYVLLRVHAQQQRAAALSDLDARLAAASGHVLASARAAAREASAAAALAAQDPRLAAALQADAVPPPPPPRRGRRARAAAPPPVDPEAREAALRDAARNALVLAERTLGFDLPSGATLTARSREALARKDKVGEGEVGAVLRAAAGGRTQRGYVRLNGAVFYAAGAPVGDGGGLVVLAPVDDPWVRVLAGASGALITLSVPETKPISTAGADARAFTAWTRGAGLPVDVGQLGRTPVVLGPLKLPPLPSPIGSAPAFRARAVQLEGLKGGFLVLAVSSAPALGAIYQLHWESVLGLALALVVGAILGFFVRSSEAPAALPSALLNAAARIERGDFAARAPQLAGKLGTLAAALNRAAELAGPAAAAESARPSEPPEELFARPLPQPAAPPETVAASAPQLVQAAARTAPAPAAPPPPSAGGDADEESHFRQVFQEFLRTRASCGEPSEGLTFEKFRLKLDGNKAALVSKYGCRTVKFQVYVKEGKAALKATPVK